MSEAIFCSCCVLDNMTPNTNLILDENGVCNNCNNYAQFAQKTILRPLEQRQNELKLLVDRIKKDGEGNQFDCLIGVSGGVDSSYLAYLAKKLGLRPLVVHFDNGWNSELAVANIHNIIEKLQFELSTYVVDWEEFKDLQLSYLKASVIDVEVPTDQFISATLHKIAYKNRIKYVLEGSNVATEFYNVSFKWTYKKQDLVNLQNIHKKFGKKPLKKYPKIGYYQRYFYYDVYGLEYIKILDYFDYTLAEAKDTLKRELNWREYGGKHYESIFTRFYQGYILPKKFGIDKRKSHLSNLIWSGQIDRNTALNQLNNPPYPPQKQAEDKEYVCKKLGISISEFEEIMSLPIVPHEFYGTENDRKYQEKRIWFSRLMRVPGLVNFIRFLISAKII
jgi:N-acetyl sugar amidotransferase